MTNPKDNLHPVIVFLELLSKLIDYYSAELPNAKRSLLNEVFCKVFSDEKFLVEIYKLCDDEFIDLGLK